MSFLGPCIGWSTDTDPQNKNNEQRPRDQPFSKGFFLCQSHLHPFSLLLTRACLLNTRLIEDMVGMTQETDIQHDDGNASDDDDSAVAFASMDFSGVDFDAGNDDGNVSPSDSKALEWEKSFAFGNFDTDAHENENEEELRELRHVLQLLSSGDYAGVLRSETARTFLDGIVDEENSNLAKILRKQIFLKTHTVLSCILIELLGVAALNIFLQGNYTGPALDDDESEEAKRLQEINPHTCFLKVLNTMSTNQSGDESEEDAVTKPNRNTSYQNAVLGELVADGEWPVQVCHVPYFLLFSRVVLLTIAEPRHQSWSGLDKSEDWEEAPNDFARIANMLTGSSLWCARAVVAHERLLQSREPSTTLWSEAKTVFAKAIESFSANDTDRNQQGATVMLEWGLAQHHFDREGKGKQSFIEAQKLTGLSIEVTGAIGKRTKFQQCATAQMLVRAKSAEPNPSTLPDSLKSKEAIVKKQLVEHGEDGILLEKIKFSDEKESEVQELTVLDQSILLAMCLDVKNTNPADGLTAEEMGAYLARVLDNHDDWMVYSTALLERSWLEFERSHARERAILQMQALADQHTNRLTITQSTKESIEESSPVQNRLKNLHSIVYPPRWLMIQDLADRYAGMGIVTSAAELFTQIEFWGEVVDCYRRAGRQAYAEKIVRECLAVKETPRMLEALGDLTGDPTHFEKAITVSNGRYSSAYIALGAFYFDRGDLEAAAENYEKALKIRPLVAAAWFRLGTISMQLKRWDDALRAFSEVVQQEPEESEAWANVAAVHMHKKRPAEAYPALVESLKYGRNNWRIWINKLFTCLDLEKYDEAVQACNVLLDLRSNQKASAGIPPLEEKCVRAIVGGTLKKYHESRDDKVSLDSSRRSLTRVRELLERISSSSDAEPWIFETITFFHQQTGHEKEALENLMKQYRTLQSNARWEYDNSEILKMCQVVTDIADSHRNDSSPENRTKARFIVRGVLKKIDTARPGDDTLPAEVSDLRNLLEALQP